MPDRHHPCLAVLNTCNECGGGDVWGSFVSPTLANEDPSRPLWPASPSRGWQTGVDRLTGRPNGQPLTLKTKAKAKHANHAHTSRDAATTTRGKPENGAHLAHGSGAECTSVHNVDYGKGTVWKSPTAEDPEACCETCVAQDGCVVGLYYHGTCYLKNATMVAHPTWSSGGDAVAMWIPGHTPTPPAAGQCNTGLQLETHGYYQHGEGFVTVNSNAALQPFDANLPPSLDPPFKLGTTCPGTYASEFGASAYVQPLGVCVHIIVGITQCRYLRSMVPRHTRLDCVVTTAVLLMTCCV